MKMESATVKAVMVFNHLLRITMYMAFLLTVSLESIGQADIEIRVPDTYSHKEQFTNDVNALLGALESSNPDLSRFIEQARRSPAQIIISPITDDPATWHEDGDRTRSHTEPLDGKPKNLGRSVSTNSVIYLNPKRIDSKERSFEEGTLVHELIHALDFAYGRYDARYEIRERRAVFLQNLWKDLSGYRLRESYHGRFSTLDYQNAKRSGKIRDYIEHILTRSDLP